MENRIVYFSGDATEPKTTGNVIIAHICNDLGAWGSGFVLDISAKWKAPEEAYRSWHRSGVNFALGEIQVVPVAENLSVANMIAQSGLRGPYNARPIRYGAVQSCLQKLAETALATEASIHLPRIGCGRAGGRWDHIEPILKHALIRLGIPVFVYDKEDL